LIISGKEDAVLPHMRNLKLLYALAAVSWLIYSVRSMWLAQAVGDHNTHLSGFFLCVLLIGIAPVALGYILLFKLVPWVDRRVGRSLPR
jgi:hypothetical protein